MDLPKVDFQKPNFSEIKKDWDFVVDMHVHSSFTDGFNSYKKMVDRALKRGISLAFTDHNDVKATNRAFLLQKRPFIVPGIEVHSREGPHILCYFYSLLALNRFYRVIVEPALGRDPLGRTNLSITEVVNYCKKFRGVVSIAHPFGPAWLNLRKKLSPGLLKEIDAFEAISGEQTRRANKLAIKKSAGFGIAVTGGSDAHRYTEVGNVLVCSEAKSVQEFLDDVRRGNVTVIGHETTLAKKPVLLSRVVQKHVCELGKTVYCKSS